MSPRTMNTCPAIQISQDRGTNCMSRVEFAIDVSVTADAEGKEFAARCIIVPTLTGCL